MRAGVLESAEVSTPVVCVWVGGSEREARGGEGVGMCLHVEYRRKRPSRVLVHAAAPAFCESLFRRESRESSLCKVSADIFAILAVLLLASDIHCLPAKNKNKSKKIPTPQNQPTN